MTRFPKTLAMVPLLAASLLLGGCRPDAEGPVRVSVIGEPFELADPARGALDTTKAVLVANAAQGLVRFDSRGNVEGGLAERWNVSDDGLSYIFRLQSGEWPSGRAIDARDVARLLRSLFGRQSRSPLRDTVGAVAEVVAMTDRVIEIRLNAPRPHLLQLLAQPEFGLVRSGGGTGPFRVDGEIGKSVRLERRIPGPGDQSVKEEVALDAATAEAAVRAFAAGERSIVLGGTFADLPVAAGTRLPRGSLRFDPVAGLFGFVPARDGGLVADPEVRSLLDRALDREALVAALGVPELEPRSTILQPGLDGNVASVAPDWAAVPLAERREALLAEGRRLFAVEEGEEAPVLRVSLPQGPGSDRLLERLRADWQPLGLGVEMAGDGERADLLLVDRVAPSVSPAWFLRQFRCGTAPVCSEEADSLLDAARTAPVAVQRHALFGDAERIMRESVLFLPVAAPVRWSLVARGFPGFAENRFARHSLAGLRTATEED